MRSGWMLVPVRSLRDGPKAAHAPPLPPYSLDVLAGAHWLPRGTCEGGMLRKEFTVPQAASRVSLFVSGCHYYELFLDGDRVGTAAGITNSWTRFNRFRSYATMSLSPDRLAPGKHVLGLHIGQGFCGEPEQRDNMAGSRAALLRIVLHHTDSSSQERVLQTVVTDSSWQIGQSPLVWESAYYGETYLSHLEQHGWATLHFAGVWPQTRAMAYNPRPSMGSQLQPAISAVHTKSPVSANRVLAPGYTSKTGAASLASPARWTFDFGQEFSGHVRLELPAGVPAYTNFTLSFGEVLSHPPLKVVTEGTEGPEVASYDGSVYLGNLFWANQVDVFQTSENGVEREQSYEPRFTYHVSLVPMDSC